MWSPHTSSSRLLERTTTLADARSLLQRFRVVSTPGPVQNALLLRSDPLRLLAGFADTGEKVSAIDLPAATVFLVNAPELVAELLLDRTGRIQKYLSPGILETFGRGIFNSEGSLHSEVRDAAKPAFHRVQVEEWSDETQQMISETLSGAIEGDVDLKALFEQMTLLMVGRLFFSVDLAAIAHEFFECTERMQQLFRKIEASPIAAAEFDAASRRIDTLLIKTLREQPQARTQGILFRALSATGSVDEPQLFQEFRGFLMASIPASLLLATACWLLAHHPESLEGLKDGETESFINETLRLYPPGWLLLRETVDELELDARSYPPGTVFLVCLWTLHRSPLHFRKPDQFLPQRWAEKSQARRGASVPFSLGARSCLGERLTRMIVRQALTALTTRFRLLPPTEHTTGNWLPRITFAPSTGIWVRLQPLSVL
jgi:cytochrome P450